MYNEYFIIQFIFIRCRNGYANEKIKNFLLKNNN